VNRQIRRLSLVFGVLLLLIMGNLSVQQVILADETKARQGNSRVLLQEYDRQRGPILVQQSQIAKSEATDNTLNYLRIYSNGPLYASATGFYSVVYGATGIEKTEDAVLNGTGPEFFVDRLRQMFGGQNVQGGAVSLTLDPAAQLAAADALGSAVGSVTAINPKTGEILAMVQSPSFDPNLLSSHDPLSISAYYEELEADPDQPLLNRPLVSTQPPGSTFKLVTSAAALEAGYQPNSILPGPATYTPPGTSRGIPNAWGGSCGPDDTVTLEESLAISCNTSFAYLGNELGSDALQTQAEKFGFNNTFAVPLAAAESRFPSNLDPAQTAQSAIGQFNVAATTLQMAMVGAAIGNGGVTMVPYLVADTRAGNLEIISTTQPREHAIAMSRQNSAELLSMMEAVVQRGTGTMAAIPGVRVGGKTGTAETGEGRQSVSWFVGVAPLNDPQVAVAVAIEDSKGSDGGPLAMTTARNVMEASLR
jgi:peptidoglycan glycosyltransferase